MLKEIVIAIQSYFEAHRFIVKNRLWKWIIIPGAIYSALFTIGIYFFIQSSDGAVSWLSRQLKIEAWLQQEYNQWLSFFFVMSGLMLRLVLFLFYFSLFKYIFLIIGSPVFSYLSEKTEAIIEGREFPFNFRQLIKDCWRGTKLALRNTLWQTLYVIGLLILTLVPVIGWITPLIALFVECYYYGFSMIDYSCERHKLPSSKSIHYINHHRGLAIGNGLVFYALHGVIFLGWIFAPAYAVIAATLSLYKVNPEQ